MAVSQHRASTSAIPLDRRFFIASAAAAVSMPSAAIAAPADPLADAIDAYRAGIAALNAIPDKEITKATEEALVMATYGPASDLLWYDTPPATSLRGVREAIRYTLEGDRAEAEAEKVLRSALAYLEGRV